MNGHLGSAIEIKDIVLFDKIAAEYSKKDIYPVSSLARKAQLFSLISLTGKKKFKSILDIGCGPGYNSYYLQNMCEKYTGVDYSSSFVDIAKKLHSNGNFIHGNIKDLHNICKKEYDMILGVGVLHHIDNLNDALKSIRKICTEKTILAIIEPYNGNPLVQLVRHLRKRLDSSYSQNQIFFSKKDLIDILRENGFEITSIKYQGYFSTPFAQVILKPAFLFYPLCKLTVFIDNLIFKYLNNSWSWNIIMVAK